MHAHKERPRARNGTPDEETLWQVLTEEPGVGVMIVAGSGIVLFSNDQAARMLVDGTGARLTGRTLDDVFPREWAQERMELMGTLEVGGTPILLRSIWRGRQLHTSMRRLNGHRRADARYLLVSRHVQADGAPDADEFQLVESRLVELGPLDVLSIRELEVLALLGQGMRIKEIAAQVHRTPKTIDNHRTSIGRKLRGADRVELARLASQAGLEMRDASLKRVHLRREPSPARSPNGHTHRTNGVRSNGHS